METTAPSGWLAHECLRCQHDARLARALLVSLAMSDNLTKKKFSSLIIACCAAAGGFGVAAAETATPPMMTTPTATRAAAIEAQTGVVSFGFDSAALDRNDERKLAGLANWISVHPGYRLVAEGFTDAYGSEVYNAGLASERSHVVRDALLATSGVEDDRVVAVVYGEGHLSAAPYAASNRAVVVYAVKMTPQEIARQALPEGIAVIWGG
ncbi:MAG: OmpA family protein [Kofleriaceae bacterium]